MNEIVIPLSKPEGVRCPTCGGHGTVGYGMCAISETEVRMRPAPKCHSCNGRGRVKEIIIVAFDEETEQL